MPRQYTLEFDLLDGHSPNTNGGIDNSAFQPVGWRSIGEPTGATISNGTGSALSACYLKTNKPGDTFKVAASSAGRLFKTIWLKNDLTEVYFMGAAIADGDNFWMRVPKNDQADIDACNQCQFDPPGNDPNCLAACPFTGQVFAKDPPAPPPGQWTKIVTANT
jgi:hypothetical protein